MQYIKLRLFLLVVCSAFQFSMIHTTTSTTAAVMYKYKQVVMYIMYHVPYVRYMIYV